MIVPKHNAQLNFTGYHPLCPPKATPRKIQALRARGGVLFEVVLSWFLLLLWSTSLFGEIITEEQEEKTPKKPCFNKS